MGRRNATRVKNLSGMGQINMDLKPNRSVSDVFINQKMDVTTLVEYMEKKKKSDDKLTYFHAFVTAFGKVFYSRPYMNRFVSNRHLFEHNDVVISFVAKVSFDDHSEEIMIMVPILPDDNIMKVKEKITDKIDSIRNKKSKKEGANDAIDTLGKLPNILRVPIIGLFKWCDKKGILPKSLVQDNLYYSSLIVSNLGPLHCGAILHNINDFGTCSCLATIGEIKDEEVIINEKKQVRKLCEFGINLDERIADGYYFIKSVKLLQYIFDHPEMLEDDASTKIDMAEIR